MAASPSASTRRARSMPWLMASARVGGPELNRVLRGGRRRPVRGQRRPAACSIIQMLALLTSFMGAKSGANVGRCQSTSGHIGPGLPQVIGLRGDAWPHPAIAEVCMACKRSGVRIP